MKYLLTVLLSAALLPLSAQFSIDDSNRKAIGFDATYFIDQFLSFGSEFSTSGDEHFLTFRKRLGEKRGLRTGFGARFGFSSTDDIDGTTTSRENTSLFITSRIGLERYFEVGRRFEGFVGGDLVGSFSRNEAAFSNEFGETSEAFQTWTTGLGPVIGMRFFATQNLAIGTEANLRLVYANSTEERTTGQPSLDYTETTHAVNMSTKADCWPIHPRNTARALCRDKPMVTAKKIGKRMAYSRRALLRSVAPKTVLT